MRSINFFRTIVKDAQSVYSLVKKNKADICSVDFFDTLVHRTVYLPNDVFRIQAGRIRPFTGDLSTERWVSLRKDTEHALSKAAKPAEIQLKDVYAQIAKDQKWSDDFIAGAMQAELDIERSVITPYVDLVDVLRRLQSEGVKIVIMTDTYLPESFMREIIQSFCDFEVSLHCSSENGHTKRSGGAYAHLRKTYPDASICHFGDNEHSDLVKACCGVKAYQIEWKRQRAVTDNKNLVAYARALGFTTLKTPYDGHTNGSRAFSVDDMAFQWSVVLADFILSLRTYANEIGATDIWFLSRDGATLHKAATAADHLFPDQALRYVYGSRKCAYPLLLLADEEKYRLFAKRNFKAEDKEHAKTLRDYYRSHLRPDTRCVLIVDMGWKGRLQESLRVAMPEGTALYGFYFSLQPDAETSTRQNSSVLMGWDKSAFYQSIVEALAGYEEPSTEGMEYKDGKFSPIFRKNLLDRAPESYCPQLELYMNALLEGWVETGKSKTTLAKFRKNYVRRFFFFPQSAQTKAYESWVTSANLDGTDISTLYTNDARGFFWALFKRRGEGVVYWPSASVAVLSKNRTVQRLLQYVLYAKLRVINLIQG